METTTKKSIISNQKTNALSQKVYYREAKKHYILYPSNIEKDIPGFSEISDKEESFSNISLKKHN